MTLQEHFGSNLHGKKLVWVGDGNNVLHDIMLGAPLLGMDIAIATPKGYEPDAAIIADTQRLAEQHGTRITMHNKPEEALVSRCCYNRHLGQHGPGRGSQEKDPRFRRLSGHHGPRE